MRAMRTSRRTTRRTVRSAKSASRRTRRIVPAPKPAAVLPERVLYRFCKTGWAVIVEKAPHAQGTRFVCPFCPHSHRVPGPVRGFQKMRRPRWIKLRRAGE
jgi:hypothetical protein